MKFLILHFQNASKYPPLLNFIFELNKVGINFICITTGKRVENNNQDLIKYSPGSEQFDIVKPEELNDKQTNALNFIKQDIMGEYMRTGVQFAINVTVFK